MGSGFLLNSLSKPAITRPSAPCVYNSFVKRYTKANSKEDHGLGVKAPSTADEFIRVAEEKAKAVDEAKSAEQGTASQTSDKTHDSSEEIRRGNTEAVKEKHKEHKSGADYHRRK